MLMLMPTLGLTAAGADRPWFIRMVAAVPLAEVPVAPSVAFFGLVSVPVSAAAVGAVVAALVAALRLMAICLALV